MTAILAALLGASAAGYITHVLAVRREQRKDEKEEQKSRELEHREQIGLLKLVHSEVTNNLVYLKAMGGEDARPEDYQTATGLKSDAWEQSRTKLAELVEEQDFEHLVSCYGSLSVLQDRLLNPKMDRLSVEE